MTEREKSIGLLALLAKGLIIHDKSRATATLGDRREYVGMSDICKGYECLRSAVLSKAGYTLEVQPEEIDGLNHKGDLARVLSILRKKITLQRGHWQEPGLQAAFESAGMKVMPQLEINVKAHGVPIKAHLDFVLVWAGERPAVRAIESKSYARLKSELYPSYEVQLYGQLGLLAAVWNQPCFAMRDSAGNLLFEGLTFPAAVKRQFGVDMPMSAQEVDIEGWVLGLSMEDARAYGPYQPNQTMLRTCLGIAEKIWAAMQAVYEGNATAAQLPYAKGFYPLCDYCDNCGDCPKFQGVEHPEYEEMLTRLSALKDTEKALKEEIEELEKGLKNAYSQCNANGDWILSGGQRFRVTDAAGRKTLDQAILRAELRTALNGDEVAVEGLLQRSTKLGAPSSRLYTGKIKPETMAQENIAA